jgi:hypothetical protein
MDGPKIIKPITIKGLRVKTTSQPFSHKGKAFGYGSLFVPVQNQDMSSTEINKFERNH